MERSAERLIVFDVDGTLVDSADTIVEAQHRTFAALGLPAPTRARALSVVGLSLPEAFIALVGPNGPIPALVAGYKAAWLAMRGEPDFAEPLFAGTRDLLFDLAARPAVVLGLATGKSRRGVDRLFETHGLRPLFATVQTADDHPSKPHPSMLLRAAAEAGIGSNATIFVGDTTFDMATARAAGMAAIGVAWGHHGPDSLVAAGATAIAADVAGLRRLLARWIDGASIDGSEIGGATIAETDRCVQSARAAPRKPVAST